MSQKLILRAAVLALAGLLLGMAAGFGLAIFGNRDWAVFTAAGAMSGLFIALASGIAYLILTKKQPKSGDDK